MGKMDDNGEAPEETFVLTYLGEEAEKSADRSQKNSKNNLVVAVVVVVLVVAGLLVVAYLFV